MSPGLLVTLTVIEIVALVVVLGGFLVVIAGHLRSISATLAKVTFGVRAVDSQCAVIGPGVTQLNGTLGQLNSALPGLAAEAERLATR